MRKNIQLCGLLLGSLTSFASAGCLRPIGEDPFGTDPAVGGMATGCGGGGTSAGGAAGSSAAGTTSTSGGAGATAGTGTAGETSGGSVSTSGGSNSAGAPAETGGTSSGGSTGETGGTSTSGGTPSSSGGSTGVPANQCGDGVLAEGEMCCTDEWLGTRINQMLSQSAGAVNNVHSCIPRDTSVSGVDLCGTAACEGGAIGCDAVASEFTATYDPATSKMSGNADLRVTGGLSVSLGLISGSCNFVAVIDNLTYTADVVVTKSSESATIAVENLVLNYTVQMQNCALPGAQEAVNQVAKTIVEPKIKEQLATAAKGTINCPY